MGIFRRWGMAASAALATVLILLPVTTASAHSLDSSTIAVRLSDDTAEATVSVALETVDRVLGTSYATAETLSESDLQAIVAYIDEHLSVTGADGVAWAESYTNATVESVEGIQSFSVDVAFDTAGADPANFSIDYDAVIASDSAHEAVVVLTDAAGDISTAGVITASDPTLTIGEAVQPGLLDMIGYGFHHVLEGADHLLFLITLLLVAPLVVNAARRWEPGRGFAPALRSVVIVATAFAVGHSLTLIATALGWISLPTAVVEVLVAGSVAVAAVHAIRPVALRGEVIIAGAFGLVHGLAFAGILSDLGFDGGLSLLTLLAFNVGVELAQLLTIALIFPSIYLLSRTRWERPVRVGLAAVALIAAGCWIIDRMGWMSNPLAGVEDALIDGSLLVAGVFAVVAVAAWITDRRLPRQQSPGRRLRRPLGRPGR